MINNEKKIDRIIINIDNAIIDFLNDNNIDDASSLSQSQWNACLIYINNIVFGNKILKRDHNIKTNLIVNNHSDGIKSNLNSYDYELIDKISDYYILLCYKYSKECSITGFCYLVGMNMETIRLFDNRENNKNLSCDGVGIYQKILRTNEETLSNGLFDGSGNPVGKIAILNHRFDWQTAAAAHGIEKKPKTADQLPDFRQNAQKKLLADQTASDT